MGYKFGSHLNEDDGKSLDWMRSLTKRDTDLEERDIFLKIPTCGGWREGKRKDKLATDTQYWPETGKVRELLNSKSKLSSVQQQSTGPGRAGIR